jgi:hypothetical protein
VIYCKSTVTLGKQSNSKTLLLEYLARYLYRIAITNRRIQSLKNGKVTFRYQNSKDHRWKTMTLDANEFIRRFLQHVLPKGFHKVRYYGYLVPSSRHIFLSVIRILSLSYSSNGDSHNQNQGQEQYQDQEQNQKQQFLPHYHYKCPRCKTGDMVVIGQAFFRKNPAVAARPPP